MTKRFVKNLKWIIPMILVICALSVGIWFVYRSFFGTSSEIEILAEVILGDGDHNLTAGNGTVILTTSNGLKSYSDDGQTEAEAAYEMDDPIVDARGDYIAVADCGGTQVQVIPGNGVVYRYSVTYPIVKICVATQGVTAVMLDAGTRDLIEVRDKEGELRVQIGTDTARDGIPVDMALSPDGKKLVSMYISFDGDDIVSKVTFYNMSDVGKNYVDNIVGQYKFAGELVWKVEFLGNDTVAVMLDSGIRIYSMSEIPGALASITPDGTIIDAEMSDSGIALVTEDAGGKSLSIYSITGTLQKKITGIRDYSHMYYNGSEVALLGSRNLTIYRKNGTCRLDMELTQSIDSIFFGENGRYFFVSSEKIKAVKVK